MDHHHYTESGLDNIWLANGFEAETFGEYGEAVSIQNETPLWHLIAQTIAAQPNRMTGQELRFLRAMFGWTQTDLGRRLGYKDGQIVAKWEKSAHTAVPLSADAWLRAAWREHNGEDARLVEATENLLAVMDEPPGLKPLLLKRTPRGEWRASRMPQAIQPA